MKKILIAAAAVIALVGIVLTVLIKIYITPDKVKAYIIPLAEESLNRKVSVESIDINILKGIGLKEFSIKESDGAIDFVRCRDFVLKFQLLPLLAGQLVIDELKIVSPSVRIERAKEGSYNFEDIGKKEQPAAKRKEDAKGAGTELPVSLLVNKISVADARFSLTDYLKELPDIKSRADVEISIKSADGAELITEGNIKIDIDEAVLRKPERPIRDVSAKLNYAVAVNLQSDEIIINRADIELQRIKASVKGAVRKFRTSPEFEIAASVPNTKTSEIQGLASLFADLKDITLSGAASAELSVKGNSDNLVIEKADLKVNEIPLSVQGSVRQLKTSPQVDLALIIPRANAGKLQAMVDPFIQMKGLKLSGDISADLSVKGATTNIESMNAQGNIAFEKIGIASDEINALLDGTIKLGGKTMTINLTASSGKNTAVLKGTVSSLFRNQNINIDLYSQRLFLEEVIPVGIKEAEPQAGGPGKADGNSVPEREAEPLKLTLTAAGEVKIDSAIYKGIHMTEFYMKYLFKNNRLEITKMTGNAGKGKFELNSFMDLSRPGYAYGMAANIDSLHAEEIVNAFVPKAKDKVFGIITTNLKANGTGTLPSAVKKNLTADADFDIKDGKIADAEIARELSLFVNVGDLETIQFTKAVGAVKIRNGIAKLESTFSSNEFSMDPQGDIGLDETLDLAFDLKLSPRLTDKAITSKIGKYMKDEGGWGTIPVLVTGTFSDPKYGIDIAKAGQRVIEKKVDRILDKLLKKDGQDQQTQTQQEPQQETEKQTQEPVKQLKDIFQQLPGMFGK